MSNVDKKPYNIYVDSEKTSRILIIIGFIITIIGIILYWFITDYLSIIASIFIVLGFLLILSSIIIICTNEKFDLLQHNIND
jgi:hypothetical protein